MTVELGEQAIDDAGVESLSDRAFDSYRRASDSLVRWLDRLGMTPSSRAKLGRNANAARLDLARIRATEPSIDEILADPVLTNAVLAVEEALAGLRPDEPPD